MVKKYLAITALLTFSCSLYASDPDIISRLHRASEDIDSTINEATITESLYQQIRPRANVTNTALGKSEIDSRVRKYIATKYAPALVMNYKHVYAQLKQENGDFSECSNVAPINENEEVLKALCLGDGSDGIQVHYMTNGYSRGWKTSAIFVFRNKNSALELSSIKLQLKEGAKAYVEGI